MFVENKFNGHQRHGKNVSESTVKRRLHSHGILISSKYADLTQQDLDAVVIEILEQFPKTGYKRNTEFKKTSAGNNEKSRSRRGH